MIKEIVDTNTIGKITRREFFGFSTSLGAKLITDPISNQLEQIKRFIKEQEVKEYKFRIGKIRLDQPFSLHLPKSIAKHSGYQEGIDINIGPNLPNRSKTGWSDEVTEPFDYRKNPNSVIISQTDISRHEALLIHSITGKSGQLLPGEYFRRVKPANTMLGTTISLTQESEGTKTTEYLKIVDVTSVPELTFRNSDAQPDNTDNPNKYVHFRTDMWGLDNRARKPGQITFVTCDGDRLWGQFTERLLVTAELFNPKDRLKNPAVPV